MPNVNKYGKYIFDEEDEESLPLVAPVEEATGINWSERIKQRREDYEAERQYLEDIEGDTVDDVEIDVDDLSESFLKLVRDDSHTKFVTIDEHPRWKEAMRRLGRL